MVRPKLEQAAENRSTDCCMSASVLELRAQSSAKRKSRMISIWLNSFPSVRYRRPTPISLSLKASVSIAENMRLKRVGARTQPSFTPFVTAKD